MQNANRLLLENGIDSEGLTDSRFKSFLAQHPSIQQKSFQVYMEHFEALKHTQGRTNTDRISNNTLPLPSARLSDENSLSFEECFALPTEPSNTDAAIDTKFPEPSENIPLFSQDVENHGNRGDSLQTPPSDIDQQVPWTWSPQNDGLLVRL